MFKRWISWLALLITISSFTAILADGARVSFRPNTLLITTGPSSGLRIQSTGFDIQSDPAFANFQSITRKQTKAAKTATVTQPGTYLISLRDGADVPALARTWATQTFNGLPILNVQPDYEYTINTTNNDPYTNYPGANNFIQLTNTDTAWDISAGSPAITIAVIDTGVQITHQDLVNQIWRNSGEIPNNQVDDDQNGFIDDVYGYNVGDNNGTVTDYVGHGTHVAGIIGAQRNNNLGISGVCPDCKLMAIKANVGNSQSFYTSDIVEAIGYAIDNGAHIINLSLGGDTYDDVFHLAVREAMSANVVVVAAAGNERTNLNLSYKSPASFPEVIAVSATDQRVFANTYSNYGDVVFVSAPGTNMVSTYPSSNNSVYAFNTGTSMATPVVSGAIGLLKSINPSLTPQNIRTIIEANSDDLGVPGKDPYYGYGFVNARAWLAAISDTDPPVIGAVTSHTVYDGETPFELRFTVTDSGIITPNVTMYIESAIGSAILNAETRTGITETRPTFTVTVTTVYPEATDLYYRIQAVDGAGNIATTPTLSIQLTDESGPIISTANTFRDDLASGFLTLTLRDRSAISTDQIRVVYQNQTYTPPTNPGLLTLTSDTLTIRLTSIGFIPTQSLLIQVVVPDINNNTTTKSILIGSAAPPTITSTLVTGDVIDTKTPIRFTVSDEDGITVNGLSVTVDVAGQARSLRYATSPTSFLFDSGVVGVYIPSDWVGTNPTANLEISVFDRLGGQATAIQSITFGTQFSAQGTNRTQLLIYPNPINANRDMPVAAYNLTQSAIDGQLIVYDLNLKRLASYQVPAAYRYSGYNEFSFSPVDDYGKRLKNGTYIAVLVLNDGTTTFRIKQKFAVVSQ